MNGTNNWFDTDAISVHQNDLYREANNDRLAHETAQPSPIVRIYAKAIATLGNRRSTHQQQGTEQRALSTAEMKAV